MRSDDSQDIKSVEVARAILHAKLKACILSPLEGNSKGQKAKKKNTRSKGKEIFIFL